MVSSVNRSAPKAPPPKTETTKTKSAEVKGTSSPSTDATKGGGSPAPAAGATPPTPPPPPTPTASKETAAEAKAKVGSDLSAQHAKTKATGDKGAPITPEAMKADPRFQKLNDGTKKEVLAKMDAAKKDPIARQNIANLATSDNFKDLSPAHQKQLLDVQAKAPKDKALTGDLTQLASNPEFRNLNDATKSEVLGQMGNYAADPTARANVAELATTKDFQQLSPAHQKQMLDVHARNPKDVSLTTDLKDLAGNADFRNLNDETKTHTLEHLKANAGEPDARHNITGLATHKDFQQLNPTHQKQMLEAQAKNPKDPALTADLKALSSDKDFRNLNDGIKSGVIAAHGKNATDPAARQASVDFAKSKDFKDTYHKASVEDKKTLESIISSPNAERALMTYKDLKKLQADKGSTRLTDEMVRGMTTGTAQSRTDAPTGKEGIISPAQAKRAGEALIGMPQDQYDKFKDSYAQAGKDGGKDVPGADAATQQQVLLKAVGARKEVLTGTDATKSAAAMKEVTDFAPEIRKMGRQELIDKTTMLDLDHTRNTSTFQPDSMDDGTKKVNKSDTDKTNDGHFQRYTQSCGPTSMQTIRGETDPVYAFKTNKEAKGDPSTGTATAKEQKAVLNSAGGIAKARIAEHDYKLAKNEMDKERGKAISNGQYNALDSYMKGSGPLNADAKAALGVVRKKNGGFPTDKELGQIREFPVTNPDSGTSFAAHKKVLNDGLGKYTGVTYDQKGPFAKGKVGDHFNAMEKSLKKGHDISFGAVDPDHWMSMSDVRGKPGSREFLVHDTWSGKTAWVKEADFKDGSFLKKDFNAGSGAGHVDSVYLPKD